MDATDYNWHGLYGGPADGKVVLAHRDAKFVTIPIRTEEMQYNRFGELRPVYREAKYKLSGTAGIYVEEGSSGATR